MIIYKRKVERRWPSLHVKQAKSLPRACKGKPLTKSNEKFLLAATRALKDKFPVLE